MKFGKRPAGLQVIILYKFAKAALSALVGVIALALLRNGTEAAAATLAQRLLDHATREWALKVATLIVMAGTRRHVIIAAVAGFTDSAVSMLEGYSLRSGAWWGPWLVVAATGALLPWELAEVIGRPDWVRIVVFLINLAVVVYLLVQARDELFERRAHELATEHALAEAQSELVAVHAASDRAPTTSAEAPEETPDSKSR